MKLQDIYEQLAYSELRQVVLGTGDINSDSGMAEKSFLQLCPIVRLGLTELHKRFLLREKEFTITLQPNQTVYDIDKKHTVSSARGKNTVKYIDDSAEPFQDDFMRIEMIYGTLHEKEYPIPFNIPGNKAAIRSPSHGSLRVPTDPKCAPWLLETKSLRVFYRADHPAMASYKAKEPLQTEIQLPPAFLQALLYYIASRVHAPKGMTNEFHEGNNYKSLFENEVSTLKNDNYDADEEIEHDKLSERGFV